MMRVDILQPGRNPSHWQLMWRASLHTSCRQEVLHFDSKRRPLYLCRFSSCEVMPFMVKASTPSVNVKVTGLYSAETEGFKQ